VLDVVERLSVEQAVGGKTRHTQRTAILEHLCRLDQRSRGVDDVVDYDRLLPLDVAHQMHGPYLACRLSLLYYHGKRGLLDTH